MKLKEKRKPSVPLNDALKSEADGELLNPLAALILSCLCGILLSGAYGEGNSNIPVGTALTAVLSSFCGMCAYMGAMLSYLVTGTWGTHITEIIAMPILCGIRLAAGKKGSAVATAVASGIVYSAAGIAAAFTGRLTVTVILAVLFRGTACCAVTYFIKSCADDWRISRRFSLDGEKGICTAVVYVIAISAVCTVSYGSFNAGCTVGMFAILAAAGRLGSGGGAAAGVLTSFGILLAGSQSVVSADAVRSTALMSCAGLAAHCFANRSKLASAVSFLMAVTVLQLFMGSVSGASELMTNAVFASAAYVLVPEKTYLRLVGESTGKGLSAVRHCASRLDFAADAIEDVIGVVSKAADILSGIERESVTEISAEVCGKVCGDCRIRNYCCKGDRIRTHNVFGTAEKLLLKNGFITERELPPVLESCSRRRELTDGFNEAYRRYQCDIHANGETAKTREIAIEQLWAADDILRCFGKAFKEEKCDALMSEQVCAILDKHGAENISAEVYSDAGGHIFISCTIKSMDGIAADKLTDKLISLTDRIMEQPEIYTEKSGTRLCWREPAPFEAEIGTAAAAGHEEISGDCSAVFGDGAGNLCCVISDGMGSGGNAAAESLIAVSLLRRLIRSGTGLKAALRTVNLMLLTKSAEESFATLDILTVNLYSGKAEFIKLGAAQSFVGSGGSVHEISGISMPLGIICSAEYDSRGMYFADGDTAALLSDGTTERNYPKIRELVLCTGLSAQKCAEEIIELPQDDLSDNFSDDRTVLIIKLHKIK